LRTYEKVQTDEIIKKDVVDQLYWDNRIDASDITVMVEQGEVTLSGHVPTFTGKRAASSAAWSVTGVQVVHNELDVQFPETLTTPSDDEIEDRVENSLLWDPDLHSFKINVQVMGGWVTLEGTVDTFWKKMQAENNTSSIRGVIGVTNKLAVVPSERITDERIAEDVVDAIDRNLQVMVDDIDVVVEDGEVTLTGTVSDWAAKSSAYNAARFTLGVIDVHDNIFVDYRS
jgi:osmotically-inducible protein OsmY